MNVFMLIFGHSKGFSSICTNSLMELLLLQYLACMNWIDFIKKFASNNCVQQSALSIWSAIPAKLPSYIFLCGSCFFVSANCFFGIFVSINVTSSAIRFFVGVCLFLGGILSVSLVSSKNMY
jgi:hypothetical protein